MLGQKERWSVNKQVGVTGIADLSARYPETKNRDGSISSVLVLSICVAREEKDAKVAGKTKVVGKIGPNLLRLVPSPVLNVLS